MCPPPSSPPVELLPVEQMIVKRIRRAKLFVFLHEQRHEVFDEAFSGGVGATVRGQPARSAAG
jgi:transposase